MDEQQIASQLQEKVRESEYKTNIAPTEIGDTSETIIEFKVDELTNYKLHRFFNEEFNPHDSKKIQQYQYIYEKIAQRIGQNEYPFVASAINRYLQFLGVSNSPHKRQKLYQWLKLDGQRTKIEMEMENVRGE